MQTAMLELLRQSIALSLF